MHEQYLFHNHNNHNTNHNINNNIQSVFQDSSVDCRKEQIAAATSRGHTYTLKHKVKPYLRYHGWLNFIDILAGVI